jgi:hypothetical protein
MNSNKLNLLTKNYENLFLSSEVNVTGIDLGLHYFRYSRVLDNLLEEVNYKRGSAFNNEDLSTLLKIPFSKEDRITYVKKIKSSYSSDLDVSQVQTSLKPILNHVKSSNVSEGISKFAEKNDLSSFSACQNIYIKPAGIEYSEHLSSVVNPLREYFKNISFSETNFNMLFHIIKEYEQFALVILDPFIVSIAGLLSYLLVSRSLHLKGALIFLFKEVGAYLSKNLSLPYYQRSLLLNIPKYSMFRNKTVYMLGVLTVTVIASSVSLFSPQRNSNAEIFELVKKLPSPAEGPVGLSNTLSVIKNSLEFAGSECFKISTAFFKGAFLGAVESNKVFVEDAIKLFGRKK